MKIIILAVEDQFNPALAGLEPNPLVRDMKVIDGIADQDIEVSANEATLSVYALFQNDWMRGLTMDISLVDKWRAFKGMPGQQRCRYHVQECIVGESDEALMALITK